MPRFLDTTTCEFRWITDPSTVVYAILSHTWRAQEAGGEQTYDEVRKIWKRMKKTRISESEEQESIVSHPDLSDKIKAICKIAREAGYKLIWIDSACIDKSSSAELAEAINLMFDLYRLADVCYVYLVDVPNTVEDPESYKSAFRLSRWHRRGWTLQELLAPKNVVFLTASWTFLGTKHSLVHALHSATNIDTGILLGRAALSSASVARRMSWATWRKTARVEDEAYSLLGIFGVHLSPIYGEGRNAFLRLQEEIVKTIPDQSIFAWGPGCYLASLNREEGFHRIAHHHASPTGLFASSPREFHDAGDIRPLSPTDYLSLIAGENQRSPNTATTRVHEVPSLHSIIAPEGVHIKALTIDLTDRPEVAAAIMVSQPQSSCYPNYHEDDYEHCLSLGRAQSLAVLRCTDQYNQLITLALFPPLSGTTDHERGLSIATHVKCKRSCPASPLFRVVRLQGRAFEALRSRISTIPVELSLLYHSIPSLSDLDLRHSARSSIIDLWPSRFSHLRGNHDGNQSACHIRLAPSCAGNLHALGYNVSPFHCQRSISKMEVVGETSIFESSVPTTRKGEPMPRTRITVTLGSETESMILVHFSISRTSSDVSSLERDIEDMEKVLYSAGNHPGCEIVDLGPSKDGPWHHTTNHTFLVSTVIPLPERVLAKVEILLPFKFRSKSEWDARVDHEERLCRVLRLTVECPLEYYDSDEAHDITVSHLWLGIDLSGPVENPEWSTR